jgi:hypothetical protein
VWSRWSSTTSFSGAENPREAVKIWSAEVSPKQLRQLHIRVVKPD